MNYEDLKNFILYKMDMQPGKNYQPVMIKTLNQNKGKISKDDLKIALQKANPEYELSHFNNCPAFTALTETHPVARYDDEDKIFYLLDHENFSDQEKAWITNYCDSKINEQSGPKYFVLDDETELANAQKTFIENLTTHTTKSEKITMGFPGPSEKVDGNANYISNVDLWWYYHDLPDEATPRFWNCFGLGEPIWGKNNNITLEINPPMKGISRRVSGAFVKDIDGNVFICHTGKLGGGNTPGGFDDVYPHDEKWILADDGKDDLRDFVLISNITDQQLPENLSNYVRLVSEFKSGNLTSQKAPYYLLFRHKSEDNPYEDDPSGKVYHFPKIANYTKVVPGAKAIWYDKINGTYYFWGYGTISKVNPRQERDFDAIFDDFTLFEQESDSIEKHGKYLKKATDEIDQMIVNRPGFNVQHSISEIEKEIFDKIIGDSKVNDDGSMMVAHKLFLIEIAQKEHKIPFTSFDHIDFVNQELDYKKIALEKSSHELSLDKWDEWISTPNKICEAVRNAVAQKISRSLIWSPPFNTEVGFFDELDDSSKAELGKSLYDLFKGVGQIETRYDNFVTAIEQIKGKPEPRLFAYLMFLYDSEKYFPIHPTNFDNLLEFYGFEKIKKVSWEKYSQYLELATKLKSFLSRQFSNVELSSIQVQSYMWVIGGAVSKNYWMIRAGGNGYDWDNQRNAGLIGIHYYTMDLSEFAHANNQLSKRKVQEKIQEIRQSEGNESSSQPALDADFGQLEKIFAVRKKDKIIAIGDNSTLLGIGNANDRYKFRTDVSENCHTVPVDWYDVTSRTIPMQEIRRTIKKLDIKDYVDIMSSQTTTQRTEYAKFFDILNQKKQFFFYGPPGTGKTFAAKRIAEEFTNSKINERQSECNQIEMVTFHQSFSYEEFVEGIRPQTDETINQVTYPIEDGIFKRMCTCAESKPELDFVLIIDEINRGNISKIFGELITLLENDKRGDKVTLPYSKKSFSIPKNLHVIGTMNTADRSLVHIDAALKRRFGQYELMPNYEKIDGKIDRVHLGKLLQTLNERIIDAKFRDNQIGHSYFMKDANPITTKKELQFAFAYDIVPLLKDYFYDDDKILKKILGNQFIDENRNVLLEWTENESVFMKSLEKAYPEAFE